MGPPEAVIGVTGDTHIPGRARELPPALVAGLRGCDLILHAGDFTAAAVADQLAAIAPLRAVAGNNDPPELQVRFGHRRVITVGPWRIGLVHGDLGDASASSRDRALAAFAGETLDVIVFGHSHLPHLERRGKLLLFNPGSPTDRRRAPDCTFGRLRLGPDGVRAEHVPIVG